MEVIGPTPGQSVREERSGFKSFLPGGKYFVAAIIVIVLIIAFVVYMMWPKKKKETYRARQPRDDPHGDYSVESAVAEITEKQEEVLERIKAGKL
jgi:cbb3-type cytochrome oxidase subunit 3